jgi:glycosyltransferase involved in cell wall biosynthesis
MLRGLLGLGLSVDLVCLNQSEARTGSRQISERLRGRYPKLRQISVRRHPSFIRRWGSGDLLARLGYHAARVRDVATWRAGRINASEHCPPNLQKLVYERLRQNSYDAVWFNYLRTIPPRLSTDATVICDLHDYQTERIRVDWLPKLRPWRRSYYLNRFAKSEREAMDKCDVAVAISPVEAAQIAKKLKPRGDVVCIPATDDLHSTGEQSVDYDLLYVGSRSDANVAGIVWFLEKCFPQIVSELPLVRLLIQGTIINTPYLKAGSASILSGHHITLSGPVENLDSVYAAAKVVICPVLHGTGMKIKMVEAMAYGQAIIATSKAAEGIATDLGLETYDEPAAFVSACVSTLNDPRIIAKRRSIAVATFNRDHAHARLGSKIRSIFDPAAKKSSTR